GGHVAESQGALLRVHVAAEHHQRLDRLGHERCGLVYVRERVWPRPAGLGAASAGRIHLGLDDARVAVVDGAENRDGAAVATRVPDEELACGRRRVAHVPCAALWAACATVSLSAKPAILAARVPGRT